MSKSSRAEGRPGRNRLAEETSPYLRLHQSNPVDWYPWGEEALHKAREEDKPIFLSVGYSTCYWCHVMERESFSSQQVADLMNGAFVNIKVDREERPELDEIYMTATQVLTHQGGWPNSVFLTPDLRPFFAGTYFPPEDRPGMPSFSNLLRSMSAAWNERRSDVEQQAADVEAAMRRVLEREIPPAASPPTSQLALDCLGGLERRFDERRGGFGGAPKFPSPSNLHLLLELADEHERAAGMLGKTLEAMAFGGLFDQLAGGFHRYATDDEWKIPHFEKMLYDNGQLLEIYSLQWDRTRDPEMARVARSTASFLAREMSAPDGAFYSAIDAETDGREGAYYVWTREELLERLGDENFGFLAPLLGFDGPPFFEGHEYVLHFPHRLTDQAERRRMTIEALLDQIGPLEASLLEARDGRERPATDDKILADWNGMVISGLARAGELLPEPDFLERAVAAADFVLTRMWPDGNELLHSWHDGKCGARALLSDYVFVIRGLLALYGATGQERWLQAARNLSAEQRARLGGPDGTFYTASDRADLLVRSREIFDGALPAANSVAALNLLELGRVTGEARWIEEAATCLRAFGGVDRLAEAAPMFCLAVQRYHRGLLGT